MKEVQAAVKQLANTYRSVVEDAQRYTLDPADVAKALADAKDGSVEQTVLLVLAKLNPVADSSKK
jgi:hypothetical protein